MKLIVDKMPQEPKECIYSSMNTGKHRCRHNALLCPLARGNECPFLMELPSQPEAVLVADVADHAEVLPDISEPKKRPAKKSTSKKSE